MKVFARSVLMLLPVLLCACGAHKVDVTQVQPLAPPIEDAPPPKIDPSTAANLTAPESVKFPAPAPPKVVVKPEEPVKKPRSKKPKANTSPGATANAPAASSSQNSQVARNDVPAPEVSAIGSLTTGEPDTQKKEARDDISAVEKGLSSISRKLSDSEEKTSSQIREYLKQAVTALDTGDVDGAKTLTMKAKVLLGELTQ